ncbi:peptidase domain protein [Stanieria cyanosphaera PCC 7437]|uniref:Peptidase domain protein n=1 Tax=Stanieria cyanosphaera (strain ATCC 29371 / PCC 7437) TaxID=111780 RepID=K9XTQ0_STAC7|nr:pre-peptidase C-terminal domain-containing protein [Stanieria cyanosphaera]AFZ35042.1 peptidase domain protein [Stanieria cyanosphaera PCC 7437]
MKYFKDNALKILLLTILIQGLSIEVFNSTVQAQSLPKKYLSLVELIAQNSLARSGLEQAIAEEINRARTDPQEYADWLEDLKQYYDGVWLKLPGEKPIRTNNGLQALEDAVEFLNELDPLPPLTLSTELTAVAEKKLQEVEASNQFAVGNVSYGRTTAEGIVMQIVIGDGFINGSDSHYLFNPDWQNTGIACQADSRYDNVCLISYGENASETDLANNSATANSEQLESETSTISTNSDDNSLLLEKIEQGSLEKGDTVIPNDGSLYDSYPLEGQAGDSFIISVESEEFDTFLAIMDAEGNILEQNDDVSDRNSNSRLKVTLPEAGVYNIIVNAYDKGGQGKYVLTVRR